MKAPSSDQLVTILLEFPPARVDDKKIRRTLRQHNGYEREARFCEEAGLCLQRAGAAALSSPAAMLEEVIRAKVVVDTHEFNARREVIVEAISAHNGIHLEPPPPSAPLQLNR